MPLSGTDQAGASARPGAVANTAPLSSGTAHLDQELDYLAGIAEWHLDAAETWLGRRDLEQALRFAQTAACLLARQNRDLTSPRIENMLLRVAAMLPCPAAPEPTARLGARQGKTCLHVINSALPSGGHTAMATRWILINAEGRVHSVAILGQTAPVPEELAEAVRASGGELVCADPKKSFVSRACWLRNLVRRQADSVVLHVDASDVLSPVAFGAAGGPPVMMVNHAAHLFWLGAATTDLVLNCRGSALERHWTEVYRGIPRSATVPIPLVDPCSAPAGAGEGQGVETRRRLGVPPGRLLILTSGDAYKFAPMGGLDFLQVCEDILHQLPDAHLAVLGLPEDRRWKQARIRTGSRLKAHGRVTRDEVRACLQAADLYIEGFPFGSTTALLEAGLSGLPVVLSPAECPPPFGSDGVAIDHVLERASSVSDYQKKVVALGQDAALRERLGSVVRRSVARHHTGQGWKDYVEEAYRTLPDEHGIHPVGSSVRTPAPEHAYWTAFRNIMGTGPSISLEFSVGYALALGLRPRVSPSVRALCKKAESVRKGVCIPMPLVSFLCNQVFPLLPGPVARFVLRLSAFLFRGRPQAQGFDRAPQAQADQERSVPCP